MMCLSRLSSLKMVSLSGGPSFEIITCVYVCLSRKSTEVVISLMSFLSENSLGVNSNFEFSMLKNSMKLLTRVVRFAFKWKLSAIASLIFFWS